MPEAVSAPLVAGRGKRHGQRALGLLGLPAVAWTAAIAARAACIATGRTRTACGAATGAPFGAGLIRHAHGERHTLPAHVHFQDILKELEKPGRDPRPEFRTAAFKEGVDSWKTCAPA